MALVLSLGVAIGLVVACMPQINGLLPSFGQAANSAAPIDTPLTTSTTQPPIPTATLMPPTLTPLPLYHFDWKSEGIYYDGALISDEDFKKLLSDAKQLQIKVECTIFEGVPAANSQKWRTIITEDIGVNTTGCVP